MAWSIFYMKYISGHLNKLNDCSLRQMKSIVNHSKQFHLDETILPSIFIALAFGSLADTSKTFSKNRKNDVKVLVTVLRELFAGLKPR